MPRPDKLFDPIERCCELLDRRIAQSKAVKDSVNNLKNDICLLPSEKNKVVSITICVVKLKEHQYGKHP